MTESNQERDQTMNKAIEKCEAYKRKTIAAALEKAKAEFTAAEGSFNDTGFDRYYNKMTKKGAEIAELEEYMNRDNAISAAIEEKKKVRAELEEIKKNLKNKLFYLLAAIPECSEGRSILEYVERL